MASTAANPRRDETTGLTPHGRAQRETLVRAAFDLIAAEGFERLRTREVAARAGVNIATLHYYFPTKEDLIRGVGRYLHHLLSYTYGTDRRPDLSEMSALGAIRHELRDDPDILNEHPEVYAVLSEFYVRARRDPVLAEIAQELDREWRDHIAGLIAAGIAEGSVRADLDPDFAALTVTGLLRGAIISALYTPNYPLGRVTIQLETLLTGKPAPTDTPESMRPGTEVPGTGWRRG